MFQIQKSMTGMHLKDAKKRSEKRMEEVSSFSLHQGESVVRGRMSPWIERKSREPAGIAANRSEVGSALPKRSVPDLPDSRPDSSITKEASCYSPMKHQHRPLIPVMTTSHTDLSTVVTDSAVNKVARWLEQIGLPVECPAYSTLPDSLTGHNTGMSSIPPYTVSVRPKKLELPSFDNSEVAPFSFRTDFLPPSFDSSHSSAKEPAMSGHSSATAKPRVKSSGEHQACVDVLQSSPAATPSELLQEKRDLAYLAVPMQDEHVDYSDTPDYRAANPSQRPQHPAKILPPTGGYKSAIPQLKSRYPHRTVRQSQSRGAVKRGVPETKRPCPIIGGMAYYKARPTTKPQYSQHTSEEDIGRRHGRKQNVSTKDLKQSGVEIDQPDSCLEETLVMYQAWVSTGRRGGDGSSTWSELEHVEGSAPRSGPGSEYNRGEQHRSNIPIRVNRRTSGAGVGTPTCTAVVNEQLVRKSDTLHVNAVTHQADTVTVKPRSAIIHGNCEKDPDVFGQARRPISGRKVPNYGSVRVNLQNRGVDRRLIVKNTGKPHPEINQSGNIRIHSSDDTKTGPSSTSGGISQPGKKSSIRPTSPSRPHHTQRSGQNSRRDSDRKHCPMFAPILAPPCTKPTITCNTSGSNTYRKSSGDEQCNFQRHFDTKPARPTSASRPHHPGQRSDQNSRSSRDHELKNGPMFAPTITPHHEKPSTSSAKPGSKTYRKTSVDEQFTLQNPVDAKPARPTYPIRQHHPQLSKHNSRSSRDHELKNGPISVPTQTPHHEKPSTSSAKPGLKTYRKTSVDEQFTLQNSVDAKPARPTYPSRQHHPQMSEHNSRSSRDHELKNGPISVPTQTPHHEKPPTSSANSGSNTYRKSSVDEQFTLQHPVDAKSARPTISSRPHHPQRSDHNSRSSRDRELKNGPMFAPPLTPHYEKPSTRSSKSGSNKIRKSSVDEQCNFQRPVDKNTFCSRHHEFKNPYKKPSTSSTKSASSIYRKNAGDTTRVNEPSKAASRSVECKPSGDDTSDRDDVAPICCPVGQNSFSSRGPMFARETTHNLH